MPFPDLYSDSSSDQDLSGGKFVARYGDTYTSKDVIESSGRAYQRSPIGQGQWEPDAKQCLACLAEEGRNIANVVNDGRNTQWNGYVLCMRHLNESFDVPDENMG